MTELSWHGRLVLYLSIHHRRSGLTPNDLEPTDTPGYWRILQPCGGRPVCHNALHGTLFNEGPVQHTISYFDPQRDQRGRFTSPYRTWQEARAARACQN